MSLICQPTSEDMKLYIIVIMMRGRVGYLSSLAPKRFRTLQKGLTTIRWWRTCKCSVIESLCTPQVNVSLRIRVQFDTDGQPLKVDTGFSHRLTFLPDNGDVCVYCFGESGLRPFSARGFWFESLADVRVVRCFGGCSLNNGSAAVVFFPRAI